MKDPVEVEFIVAQAGLDIGDTVIGMHIKHVQIPIRPILKELGAAPCHGFSHLSQVNWRVRYSI